MTLELKADEKCDRGILARLKETSNRKKGEICVCEKERDAKLSRSAVEKEALWWSMLAAL